MNIKLIECPRDAMQGIHHFIPTEVKINYINTLLKAGFDTLDFGSFVSPKAIPQLADTVEVLNAIDTTSSATKLLAITANFRGAEAAVSFEKIKYIGFPYSISETFQLRNTNSTMLQSLDTVKSIQELCQKNSKELVLYISMGFGNPYGDVWSPELVEETVIRMKDLGIQIISLSDTVGVADKNSISNLFSYLIPKYPSIEFGAHLHTTPDTWKPKIEAAFESGCRRFDGALKGYGGCPMAADKLTGNMPTENLISFLEEKKIPHGINHEVLADALIQAISVFN